MNSISEPMDSELLGHAPAANADQLGELGAATAFKAPASGWDAYEVWRRCIKDARDRRLTER